MQKFQPAMIAILAVMLCATLSGRAAWSQGADNTKMQEAAARASTTLDKIHRKVASKPNVLAKIKEKLQQKGLTDVDARLAAISKILDQAATMNDATYEQNKKQLVGQMLMQMHGPGTKHK